MNYGNKSNEEVTVEHTWTASTPSSTTGLDGDVSSLLKSISKLHAHSACGIRGLERKQKHFPNELIKSSKRNENILIKAHNSGQTKKTSRLFLFT